MTQNTFKNVMPSKFVDEYFRPIPDEEQFKLVNERFADFWKTDLGRKHKADIRGKIFNFVDTNGFVGEGRSNRDPMGIYIAGDVPKRNDQLRDRAQCVVGEQMYAEALVSAFNDYVKDTGFKFNKDNNYTSRWEALLAQEADSIAGKGPYDNASSDTALKTVVHVLENHSFSRYVPDHAQIHLDRALFRRYTELKKVTNRSYTVKPSQYLQHMQEQGLSKTMRGFPFYSSGNSLMKDYWVEATKIMFMDTPVDIDSINWRGSIDDIQRDKHGQPILKDGQEVHTKRNMTVDEFIQEVLIIIYDRKLRAEDWFSLAQVIIIPISRNQGSAFKVKIKNNQLYLTGERKDMKYRLVTPIAAFVQAMSIICCDDLVRNVKRSVGRTGLMDPHTNEQGMNDYIRNAYQHGKVIISTDFDAYDSTINAELMIKHCNMYTYLYKDDYVKQGIIIAALSLSFKIMLLPCYLSDREHPIYNEYIRYFHNEIKGDPSFANNRVKSQKLFDSGIFHDTETKQGRYDYRVIAFLIYKGYLPSGHILTNLIGSDCTLAMGRTLIPAEMGMDDGEANASGDDCIMEILLSFFLEHGLEGTYDAISKAYEIYGMIVKAEKQLHILYKGLPLVDFLQHPYIQGADSVEYQPTYNKAMRQFPSLPWMERNSRLYPVMQWVIVLGKGEAGICKENVDLGAYIIKRAGYYLHEKAKKKRYRPNAMRSARSSKDPQVYDVAYSIQNSPYLGLGQLLGLVKTYKQELVSALGQYAAGKLDVVIDDYERELEAKAPHREGMAKAMYKALGNKYYEQAGGDKRFGDVDVSTHFYFIEALQKVVDSEGDSVPGVILDTQQIMRKPEVSAMDMVDPSENADNYEFDAGQSD